MPCQLAGQRLWPATAPPSSPDKFGFGLLADPLLQVLEAHEKDFAIALLLALGTTSGVLAQGSTKQDNTGSAVAPGATTPTSPGGAAPTSPGGAATGATGTPPAGAAASGPDPQNTSPQQTPLSPAESGGPRPGGGVGGGTR
jgi:hypothetical protein